jgi:Uma2 family endonuclease
MATVLDPPKTIPLGPRDAGQPFTSDEFESSAFEAGYRYELIRGVLVVSPAPLEEERDANEELGYWLRRWSKRTLREGDRYATKLLPGFGLPLADLFRVCDRYGG